MHPAVWIAIFLPIIISHVIVPIHQRRNLSVARKNSRKRGVMKMSNELIKRYIGKVCNISTGTYGSHYKRVRIIELVDNWIKVEAKGNENLINTDYIQSITIISN